MHLYFVQYPRKTPTSMCFSLNQVKPVFPNVKDIKRSTNIMSGDESCIFPPY